MRSPGVLAGDAFDARDRRLRDQHHVRGHSRAIA